jgi:hypothetical protein
VRSNRELVNALRGAPELWLHTAIVVAFENRFEFVGEDHSDPMNRLKSLEDQGGLAIGLAGFRAGQHADRAFLTEVFEEYQGQQWAHRYMDTLRRIVRRHSK